MSLKTLTMANWREPDPTNEAFGRMDPATGTPVAMQGDDWARLFLAVEVATHVPNDLREMFNIARGACLYGWFFYPLYTVGQEQLFRILEAAALERVSELGGPSLSNFHRALEWLQAREALPTGHRQLWSDARELRNLSAHAQFPQVQMPAPVLHRVEQVAELLNGLFDGAKPADER